MSLVRNSVDACPCSKSLRILGLFVLIFLFAYFIIVQYCCDDLAVLLYLLNVYGSQNFFPGPK